jgi:hypothetical protein
MVSGTLKKKFSLTDQKRPRFPNIRHFLVPIQFFDRQLATERIHFELEYFCETIHSQINRHRPTASAEDARRNIGLHFDNGISHTAHEASNCSSPFE